MLWNKKDGNTQPKLALILSGGGARAAYQVGVLKALADLLPKDVANPFPILCGTSAGAINTAALAIYSEQFREAVWRLVHVWHNFHVDDVFRASWRGLSVTTMHWLAAMALGGLGRYNPVSLLDRSPLERLLMRYLPFERVQQSIDAGRVHALCINASSYTTSSTVAFFQGVSDIEPWQRTRRRGVRAQIGLDHLLASSAIPFVFGAQRIGDEYYGDGSMRQTAPISPALHLGADKLFIVGVKHDSGAEVVRTAPPGYPSLGQIAGQVLDSIFLDNIDMDQERLLRINNAMAQIPDKHLPSGSSQMRPVELFSISPSQDLFTIAEKHANLMPRSVRFFMRGLGVGSSRGSNLLSYILFEQAYCRELIHLGFSDTMERSDEVLDFMGCGAKDQTA